MDSRVILAPHRWVAVLACIAALAVMVGCASHYPEVKTHVVLYHAQGTGSDQARLSGVLAAANGCLVVKTPSGTTLVYLPDNAVTQTAEGDLELFGVKHRLGDSVVFTGGYYGIAEATVPPGCGPIEPTWTLFTVGAVA